MNDTIRPHAAEDEPDLIALLGSRLCHDLASPLGALNNGVELLELTEETPTEEIKLLRATLDTTIARLRFFRLAFGGGGANSEIGIGEASAVVEQMYRESRRRVTWHDAEPRARSEIKLAFLVLNCIEVETPWGGAIDVRRRGDAWSIEVAADRLKRSPHWNDLVEGRVPMGMASAEVQFGILARAAATASRTIAVERSETMLKVTV